MHRTTLGWLTLLLAMVALGVTVLPVWAWPTAATPAGVAPSAAALVAQAESLPRRSLAATQETILQPGSGDTTTLRDAQIRDDTPDTNDATGALQVRHFAPEDRALLHWTLPSSLEGATIESARLELYLFQRSTDAAQSIALYEVLSDWDEAAVTWRKRLEGQDWITLGCNAPGLDRASTPVSTRTIATTDPVYAWYSWDVTALVAKWAQEPAENHGLILVSSGGTVRNYFHSSEMAGVSQRPKLVIRYSDAPPTSTPTATTAATATTSATAAATVTSSTTPMPTNTTTSTRPSSDWIDVSRAVGAFCNGSFDGNTTGKPATARYYGGLLDWDESGPEDVYVLRKTAVSDLTVRLEWEGLGADLDVFLLSGPDPALLMPGGRGDKEFTLRDLAPGVYYVVVDGFQGSSGTYRLSILCEGEPTPTPTITLTPSPTNTPAYLKFPVVLRQPSPTPTATPTFTPSPTVEPYARGVNCGSQTRFVAEDGWAYEPDQPYTPGLEFSWGWEGGAAGDTWTTRNEIYNTRDDVLYQSHRFAMTRYRFRVPSGRYEVWLHFAEIFPYINPGGRVFAVELEGQRVLDQFDMRARGLKYTPHIEKVVLNVVDGELDIVFVPQSTELAPAINGLRVQRIGPAQ